MFSVDLLLEEKHQVLYTQQSLPREAEEAENGSPEDDTTRHEPIRSREVTKQNGSLTLRAVFG